MGYRNTERLKREAVRKKLGRAIRSGKITRGPCSVCGDSSTEAHHEDYDKPFEVMWLCMEHHQEFHKGKLELVNGVFRKPGGRGCTSRDDRSEVPMSRTSTIVDHCIVMGGSVGSGVGAPTQEHSATLPCGVMGGHYTPKLIPKISMGYTTLHALLLQRSVVYPWKFRIATSAVGTRPHTSLAQARTRITPSLGGIVGGVTPRVGGGVGVARGIATRGLCERPSVAGDSGQHQGRSSRATRTRVGPSGIRDRPTRRSLQAGT